MHDEPKTPIDTERLAAMLEGVLVGHPREAELRSAIDAGARLVPKLPDDPGGDVLVYLPAPDGELHDPVGAFPVADLMPSQN